MDSAQMNIASCGLHQGGTCTLSSFERFKKPLDLRSAMNAQEHWYQRVPWEARTFRQRLLPVLGILGQYHE